MNVDLLKREIAAYARHRKTDPDKYVDMTTVRAEHADQIHQWSKKDVLQMDEAGLYQFIAPLWAMLI